LQKGASAEELQTIRSKQTQKTGFEDVLKKDGRPDLLKKSFELFKEGLSVLLPSFMHMF